MSALSMQVQSPEQARLAAESQAREAMAPTAPPVAAETAETAEGEGQVFQFPGNHEPAAPSGEQPVMRVLLDAYKNRQIEPEHVALGPMPEDATKWMRDIAADMQVRFGLDRAAGFQRPLMYANSEAVKSGIALHRDVANNALKRLCAAGVIRHVGEMPPRGMAYGTRLYVPPGWWPTDPEARAIVEATGKHPDAANLIWVPDDQDGGAA